MKNTSSTCNNINTYPQNTKTKLTMPQNQFANLIKCDTMLDTRTHTQVSQHTGKEVFSKLSLYFQEMSTVNACPVPVHD